MPLNEGVQSRLTYKFYASGALVSNAEAVPATAPAATGGRLLRRVSSTMNLRKNTYRSNEIRQDRQIGDFRHGTRRAEGSITGEFSAATYFDFIEAAHRHTKVAALSDSNTEFTSVAADNATSTFTYAGGDPVAEGYRVGDIKRYGNLSEALNNNRNYTILGFSGTSNRVVTVSPAPTTMSADSAFTVTRPGVATFVPSSGHVSRLVAIEDHGEDVDISRLFTECRVTGYRMGLPAEGMATFEAMLMGRGMTVLTAGSAPFFTAPTAITSTGINAAVNGLVQVNGTTVGVVTGLDLSFAMAAEAPSVVGQVFPPEIFLGTADVTGTLTALFENSTLIGNFTAEDEISILVRCDATNAAAADSVSIYLPRIKFTAADVQRSGEGAQPISLPFQALRYLGAGIGIESTTIRIVDTAAT
jgi:CBS domain-containing protein